MHYNCLLMVEPHPLFYVFSQKSRAYVNCNENSMETSVAYHGLTDVYSATAATHDIGVLLKFNDLLGLP